MSEGNNLSMKNISRESRNIRNVSAVLQYRSVFRREVGTTFTVGPCVPTILCALLAHTALVVEPKLGMLQVAIEKASDKVLNLTYGSILVLPV